MLFQYTLYLISNILSRTWDQVPILILLWYLFTLFIFIQAFTHSFPVFIINQPILDKFIPLITFMLGYMINKFEKKIEENKALERYEYTIIIDIIDIDEEHPRKKIQSLYDQLKRDPSYFKTKNYNLIQAAIREGLSDKKIDTKELEKIKNKFENKFKIR